MSTARRQIDSPPASSPTRGAHLDLIPVDPHRIFAHWRLPPADLARLNEMAGGASASQHLTLRVFRLPNDSTNLSEAVAVEDFPIGSASSDGYFSLARPGGQITGVIGVKNAENRFTPAATSIRVALPEASRAAHLVESEAPVPAPPATNEKPAPAADVDPATTTRPAQLISLLDEDAIVEAAGRITSLPEQLRTMPANKTDATIPVAPPSPEQTTSPTPPETPTLDERRVVTSALRHMLATAQTTEVGPPPVRPLFSKLKPAAGAAPTTSDAGSSHRLASQASGTVSEAPLHVRATIVVTGTLAPGQKLRIGDQQVTADPGGRFALRQRLDATEGLWPLLLQTVLQRSPESIPSIELLGRIPDSEALLSMHATIEIEGEIREPAYRSRLPDGVMVDDAGRFRIVRSLPAGALLLPHLLLVAGTPSAQTDRP